MFNTFKGLMVEAGTGCYDTGTLLPGREMESGGRLGRYRLGIPNQYRIFLPS